MKIIKTNDGYYLLGDKVEVVDMTQSVVSNETMASNESESGYIFNTSLGVIEFEKHNLRPKDPSNLPLWCEYDSNTDEYYWTYDAMINYAKDNNIVIPTKEQYIACIQTINSDYSIGLWHKSVKKFYDKIGGKLSGFHSAGSPHFIGTYGYLRSASASGALNAWAVRSDTTEVRLGSNGRHTLFPVRALRTPQSK